MEQKNLIQNSVAAQDEKAIARKSNKKTVVTMMESMKGEIAKALPSVITPERFSRLATTTLSSNTKLQECTPISFIGAMMQCAQLGMEPNTQLGQGYLLPFYNRKSNQLEVQFQLGYRGLIQLAYRSGQVRTISAETVYANDKFELSLGLHRDLIHVPATVDRGEPIGYYGVYETKDGGYGFAYMTIKQIREFAKKYSKSFSDGPWQSDFEAMAKKTVLKQALKYAPLSTDFAREVQSDETVKTKIDADMLDVAGEEILYDIDQATGEIKD